MSISLIFTMISCSFENNVRDYFESHGMSYPADVNGVSLWGISYSGITREELAEPGVREFIEEGLGFIKGYFLVKNIQAVMPGVSAVVVNKPVLFRGDSGEVGLMVKVAAYGNGTPGEAIEQPVEWLGEKQPFWKFENYAYFNRAGGFAWQHGGWVFD